MAELTTLAEVRRLLEEARVVAVLGAHPERLRPAFYVPDYLARAGYRVLPVNPAFSGRIGWGEPYVAHLPDLAEPVDVVDVFRRSDALPDHLPEILAMAPLPRAVWLQQGVRHAAVARALVDAGIDVVQDRCMLADHRALGLGPRAR